jgi:uncharacterized protein (TIGR02186 family)
MRAAGTTLGAAAVALCLAHVGSVGAVETLVADLSSYRISITSSFQGADVLLFGATEGGGDVVVVVRGPAEDLVVRRKEQVAGIWVNRGAIVFADVPSYYSVSSTRPLDEALTESQRRRLQIGARHLTLRPRTPGVDEAEIALYHEALTRNKERERLFQEAPGSVTFLDSALFRTRVHFPANAPVGRYNAAVYLVRDGQIITAQSTPLFISKSGVERAIFDFADRRPASYGILAVILASLAGWLASVVFRRR